MKASKARKRLAARIAEWEQSKTLETVDARNKKQAYSGFNYRKPGSNKK